MVNVTDAELIIAGTVIGSKDLTNRETGEYQGRKVTIITGDGIGVVKVDPTARVQVVQGGFVLWVIRNAAYAIDGNSGMSSRFLRECSELELSGLQAALAEASKASKAAA